MTGSPQPGTGAADDYTREAADPSAADSPVERRALLLLLGLTLLGLILRFWHLGEWNFQATEMFTYRDSQRPQFANPRPLGYLLNYFVVRPFIKWVTENTVDSVEDFLPQTLEELEKVQAKQVAQSLEDILPEIEEKVDPEKVQLPLC